MWELYDRNIITKQLVLYKYWIYLRIRGYANTYIH